jgi:hypothetical protein
VVFKKSAPGSVAEFARAFRRLDDVGEKHRCQNPVGDRGSRRPRQESLDLIEKSVLVPHPGEVVFTRQLHEAGPGDLASDPPGLR